VSGWSSPRMRRRRPSVSSCRSRFTRSRRVHGENHAYTLDLARLLGSTLGALITDMDNARPRRDTSVVLEDLVGSVNQLRQEFIGARRAINTWPPQVSEFAIYDEISELMERAGVSPQQIRLLDMHPNGKMFLLVHVYGPVAEDVREHLRRAIIRRPKYFVRIYEVDKSKPVVPAGRRRPL
jgi:hypothetical protein